MFNAPYPSGGTPPRITEDSPAWHCATMGNRVCGKALAYTGVTETTALLIFLGGIALILGFVALLVVMAGKPTRRDDEDAE